MSTPHPSERALTLVIFAASVAQYVVSGAPEVGLALLCGGLGLLAARRSAREAALFGGVTGLLGVLHASPEIAVTWPLPLLVSLGLVAVIARRIWGAGVNAWWVRGAASRADLGLAAAFVVIPGLSLWAWLTLTNPDLSDLLSRFGGYPAPLYALGALAFAMLNALAEEALFRGVAWAALERATGSPLLTLALQASAFGLAHIHGFPRGASGVLLATIYGAMMGELRRRTGGLALPWFAHVFADCVIAALIYASL